MPRKQLLLTTFLIVVPALALALLSLLSVRSQKESTDRERERLADKLGKGIQEQFDRSFSQLESLADAASTDLQGAPHEADALSVMLALPHVEALFILGGNGSLEAPVPPWKTPPRVALDPDFRAAFDQAEALEISGKTQEAAARYEVLLSEKSNSQPQALLLNALARCHRKTGQLDEASELYGQILSRHPTEFSATGTSLASVAALESMAIERDLKQPERALEICQRFLQDLLNGRIYSSRDEAAYYAAEVATLLKEPFLSEEPTRGACERALARLRNVLAAERAAGLLSKDPAPQKAASRKYIYRDSGPEATLGIKGLDADGRSVAFCLHTEAFKIELRRAIERLLQYAGNFDYEIRDARQVAWIAAKNGPLTPPVVRFSPERFPGWELSVTVPESQAMQSSARLRILATSGLILLLLFTIGASLYFMNTMVRRTAELSALKTDFVSAVSHEMRTPLATIRMIAEMFQMQRVKDLRMSQEYIETVTSETERLTRLINKVLDFSRMDSGRKPYSLVPAELGPLVSATVQNFETGISQDCRIDVVIEPDLPEARVDEDAIVQALINLLDNAVKYSPEPAQVRVTLMSRDGELLLQVADRGIGIDPRKQGMIFEKFYRCEDELTRRTTGTGIGLSIVQYIAEAHAGRIEVQSVPGQGSVFTLHLPLQNPFPP